MLNTQRLLLLAWDNLGVGIIVVITTRDNHYYDENEIEVGNPPQCRIISNVHTDLTEEEKKEARQKAIEQYQQAELRKMQDRNKPKAKPAEKVTNVQPSLFDF